MHYSVAVNPVLSSEGYKVVSLETEVSRCSAHPWHCLRFGSIVDLRIGNVMEGISAR